MAILSILSTCLQHYSQFQIFKIFSEISGDKMKINSKQMLMNKAIVFVENNIGLILIIIIFYLFIAYLKLYT